MGGVNQLRGQSLPQVLKFPPAAGRMPFNLFGMGRAVLAVNCGVSVSRCGQPAAGKQWHEAAVQQRQQAHG
jgi:hypothetical protein